MIISWSRIIFTIFLISSPASFSETYFFYSLFVPSHFSNHKITRTQKIHQVYFSDHTTRSKEFNFWCGHSHRRPFSLIKICLLLSANENVSDVLWRRIGFSSTARGQKILLNFFLPYSPLSQTWIRKHLCRRRSASSPHWQKWNCLWQLVSWKKK